MRFLVDTHCWLWALESPEKLRPEALAMIKDAENVVLLSAVSALEIAIKYSTGKLQLPEPPEAFVSSRMVRLAMTPLPVFFNHALRVSLLPYHHRDPFDRLLVAQSQVERLPLMTADAAVGAYDVEVIWAGRGQEPRELRRWTNTN